MDFHITTYDISRQRNKKRKDPLTRMQRLIEYGDSRYNPNKIPWIKILKREPCVYCGKTKKITIDHIIPKTNGGTWNNDNLTSSCLGCNNQKGAMSLLMFLILRTKTREQRIEIARKARGPL